MKPRTKLLGFKKLKQHLKFSRQRAHGPPGGRLAGRLVSMLTAVLLLGWQVGTPAAMALANPDKVTPEPKVTICHRTNSVTNPYVQETVAASSVDGNTTNDHGRGDHLAEHTGPVFDPNADYPPPHNGDQWGDIIPPFNVDGQSYDNPQTSLNWTTAGRAIWDNDCKVPTLHQQTGSVQVNKQVDVQGNGVYSGGNALANELGFMWGLDNQTPARAMGSTANNVSVGTHTVTENVVAGYHFTGWFYTGRGENSCTNPVSTQLPSINVVNNETTSITLCNQVVIRHVRGSITIIKNAAPNSTQPFSFTIATTNATRHFTLEDNGNNTSDFPKQRTFDQLRAGVYVVTEANTQGWTLQNISCNEGADVEISGSAVSINLGEGQNVTCRFLNRQNVPVHGRIVVFKRTVPAGDRTKFTITASGTGTIAGDPSRFIKDGQHKTFAVTEGTYNISELAMAGWAENTSQCRNLVISRLHPVATCTITNTKTASLTIVKDAQPNSAKVFSFTTTGAGLSNFTLRDTGSNNSRTFSGLLPGSFSVRELAATGWTLRSISCTGGASFSISGSTVSLALAAGSNATCTFTNRQVPVVLGITTGGRGGGVVVTPVTTTPVVSGAQLVNTGSSPLKTILLGVVLLALLAGATRVAYPGKQK